MLQFGARFQTAHHFPNSAKAGLGIFRFALQFTEMTQMLSWLQSSPPSPPFFLSYLLIAMSQSQTPSTQQSGAVAENGKGESSPSPPTTSKKPPIRTVSRSIAQCLTSVISSANPINRTSLPCFLALSFRLPFSPIADLALLMATERHSMVG